MVDYRIIGSQKGFNDFQEEAGKNSLANALAQAQIQNAQLQMAKAMKPADFDLKDLGQKALVMKQLGMPLSKEQQAYADVYSASTEGIYTDLLGNAVRKPGIAERLGGAPQIDQQNILLPPESMPAPSTNLKNNPAPFSGAKTNKPMTNDNAAVTLSLFDASGSPASTQQPELNQWEQEYLSERARLIEMGDRKSAQVLDQAWAKSKIEMNEAQGKAAGFADRMRKADPLITEYTPAGLEDKNVRLDRNLPDFIANRFVSEDYQSFSQAQKDFINAQLRRESGAVITPGEFQSAAQQYFPQVGDSEQVLAQKAANRKTAVNSMTRDAGPAYKAGKLPDLIKKPSLREQAKADFNAKKAPAAKTRLKYNPATGEFE